MIVDKVIPRRSKQSPCDICVIGDPVLLLGFLYLFGREPEMGEDVKKRAEKEIDDLTKEFNDKVEAEFKGKSEEIMKL